MDEAARARAGRHRAAALARADGDAVTRIRAGAGRSPAGPDDYVCGSRSGRLYGLTRTTRRPTHALVDTKTCRVVEWVTSEEQRILAGLQTIRSPGRFLLLPAVSWAEAARGAGQG